MIDDSIVLTEKKVLEKSSSVIVLGSVTVDITTKNYIDKLLARYPKTDVETEWEN